MISSQRDVIKEKMGAFSGKLNSPSLAKKKFVAFSRIVFGGIFITASIDKILHPRAFAEVIFNYRILPDVLINLVATIIPWIEFTTGFFVVIGVGIMGGLAILNGLLAIFSALIVFNIIRGVDISCGCFSTEVTTVSTTTMWLELLRDLSILALGLWLFRWYTKICSIKS